jgi:hypothetical protein
MRLALSSPGLQRFQSCYVILTVEQAFMPAVSARPFPALAAEVSLSGISLGSALEPHKQHLFRRFLLRERPVHELNHRCHYGKSFCQLMNNARAGEHADRERGFQIPLLSPQ